MNEKKLKQKKEVCILGIIAGILIFISGIYIMQDSFNGVTLEATSFGGDAYTYIYKGTRATSENVVRLAELMNELFGGLMMAIGAFTFLLFDYKLLDMDDKAEVKRLEEIEGKMDLITAELRSRHTNKKPSFDDEMPEI